MISAQLKQRLATLQENLEKLEQKDSKRKVFGSGEAWGGHHYQLAKCLPVAKIRTFEKKENIQLPEEYVAFLTTIGNGGAGPSYGLMSFKEAIQRENLKKLPKSFSKKFLYTSQDAQKIMAAHVAEAAKGLQDFERSTLPQPENGFIFLVSHGCGEYSILVISGKQAGKVWYKYENAVYADYALIEGKPVQLSFLDWYEKWLDEALKVVSQK